MNLLSSKSGWNIERISQGHNVVGTVLRLAPCREILDVQRSALGQALPVVGGGGHCLDLLAKTLQERLGDCSGVLSCTRKRKHCGFEIICRKDLWQFVKGKITVISPPTFSPCLSRTNEGHSEMATWGVSEWAQTPGLKKFVSLELQLSAELLPLNDVE